MFKGCCTALITPFGDDGNVDYRVFENIIEKQIESGVKALLFLGTTGESPTLTDTEQEEIVKFAVEKVGHRIPVLVGGGVNSTQKTIDKCLKFKSYGVDGFLVVTPYYNKATQQGLYMHFSKIAREIDMPIILYNVPGRTGVNLQPKTIIDLSKEKNIVGLKQAQGNIDELMEILSGCNRDFLVYSGEDSLTYAMMSLGGAGVISVVSNVFPKEMAKLCLDIEEGNLTEARKMQFAMNPLIKELFEEVNPIPIKQAMIQKGTKVGIPRLPLTESTRKEEIKKALSRFEERCREK